MWDKLPDAIHLKIRRLGIGDTVAATSLVRDIKVLKPDIRLSISGRETDSIFQYDDRVGPHDPDAPEVELDYKSTLHRSLSDPSANYVLALHDAFEKQTGIKIPRGLPVPSVILGPNESRIIPEPYCVVASGVKGDIPVKNWGPSNFAKTITATKDWNWIQVGDVVPARIGNIQTSIPDATNWLGRTSIRELIVLIAHADLVLCHVSLPMLLAASFGIPCVAILGGRESPSFFTGLGVTILDTIGALPCCQKFGCLAAAAIPDRKPEEFPYGWLCSNPVIPEDGVPVGKCMSLISPETVIRELHKTKFRDHFTSSFIDGILPFGSRRPLPIVEL